MHRRYHRYPAGPPLPQEQRFGKSDIDVLYEKAKDFVRAYPIVETKTLLRDKTIEYYKDIKQNKGNIETPLIKDNHGDPRNPTNHHLRGLFFNTFEKEQSIYGNCRFTIDPDVLLNVTGNLYFADFYCNNSNGIPHYIQLVLTKPGTEYDSYCELHLAKISLTDPITNPFFYKADDTYYVRNEDLELWVELYVTESVDLDLGKVSILSAQRWQTFKRNPCRKSPNCTSCNI